MSKFTFQRFLTYFFRGLLFVVPLALTIYIIYQIIEWVDGLIPVQIPGLGLIIIIVNITFLGYLASFFITRPFFDQMEKYLVKIPLVNIIYTSVKDLLGAFVGEQKRFNIPVTVAMTEDSSVLKVGFITRDDLSEIDLPGYVSVYLPHSYNFSGNHFLVKKEQIKHLHMNSTNAMKFVVSGGVSGIEEELKKDEKVGSPKSGSPK